MDQAFSAKHYLGDGGGDGGDGGGGGGDPYGAAADELADLLSPLVKQARTKAAPPWWAVPLWVQVRTLSWRCRESNPGPSLLCQGFSERSSLCLYSALRLM